MTQRWTQRLTRGALTLGVVLAVATPAQANWWCNGMQRAMAKRCCKEKVAPPTQETTVSRAACCEFRVPEAAAPASLRTDLDPKAPLATLAPLAPVLAPAPAVLSDARTASARAHREGARAGPGRSLHERVCVYLI